MNGICFKLFFLSWIKLIQIGSLMNSLWNLSSPLPSSFLPACTSSHTCKPQRVKAFHRFFSCKPVFLHTVKVVISPFFFSPSTLNGLEGEKSFPTSSLGRRMVRRVRKRGFRQIFRSLFKLCPPFSILFSFFLLVSFEAASPSQQLEIQKM